MCNHVIDQAMTCNRKDCPNRQPLPEAVKTYAWINAHYQRIMTQADLTAISDALQDEYYIEAARKLPRRLYVVVQQAIAVLSAPDLGE